MEKAPTAIPDKPGEKNPDRLGNEEERSAALKQEIEKATGGLTGGYDGGLFLRSTKAPGFDIKFNFLGQIWYDHIADDPSYPPLEAAAAFPSDGDSFILRRGEIKLSGHMTERVGWVIMIDPPRAIGGRAPPLVQGSPTEAFVQNKRILKVLLVDFDLIPADSPWYLLDRLTLRVGQHKTPQTYEGELHAGWLDFPERSIGGFLFGDVRTPGAELRGTAWGKRIEFETGVFNGNGGNPFRDESDDKDFISRLVVHPFGGELDETGPGLRALSFGSWAGTGRNGRADRLFHQDSVGVEFNLEYARWFIRAEWYHGKPVGSNLTAAPSSSAPQVEGWYTTFGVNLTKHWQAAVRYQRFDPSKDVGGDMVDATTFGLTYFFDEKHHPRFHGAKIQLAYNIYNVGSIAPASPTGHIAGGNELTVAFQVDY